MSKHTPGPWSIHEMTDSKTQTVDNEDGKFFKARTFCVGQGKKLIADVNFYSSSLGYPRVRTEKEAEANARLIAAAPELLAALQRLLRQNADDYYQDPWYQKNYQLIAQAIAAVAKAKGETS